MKWPALKMRVRYEFCILLLLTSSQGTFGIGVEFSCTAGLRKSVKIQIDI